MRDLESFGKNRRVSTVGWVSVLSGLLLLVGALVTKERGTLKKVRTMSTYRGFEPTRTLYCRCSHTNEGCLLWSPFTGKNKFFFFFRLRYLTSTFLTTYFKPGTKLTEIRGDNFIQTPYQTLCTKFSQTTYYLRSLNVMSLSFFYFIFIWTSNVETRILGVGNNTESFQLDEIKIK